MAGHFFTENLCQDYFRSRNIDLSSEMKLLVEGGKLNTEESWGNVIGHCLVQAVAADVISDLLKLGDENRQKLIKVAIVHDWKKRIERKPGDFTEDEIKRAEDLFRNIEIKLDQKLMSATGCDFITRIYQCPKEVSFLEKLQFYLDDITKDKDIVRFKKRVNEVEARRPELNEDKELTEKLGGDKYWEAERKIGYSIEGEIFGELKKRGVEIENPERIPDLIKKEMRTRL